MSTDYEDARAEKAKPSEISKAVKRARGLGPADALDVERASLVQVGDRRWAFVLTKRAVETWKDLGSQDLTVGVLIYEQSGAAAPFVHREIAVRPGKKELIVEVREGGLARWTGKGSLDSKGALQFSVSIDSDRGPGIGLMAGQVTRDGQLIFKNSRLPRPTAKRVPEQVAVD